MHSSQVQDVSKPSLLDLHCLFIPQNSFLQQSLVHSPKFISSAPLLYLNQISETAVLSSSSFSLKYILVFPGFFPRLASPVLLLFQTWTLNSMPHFTFSCSYPWDFCCFQCHLIHRQLHSCCRIRFCPARENRWSLILPPYQTFLGQKLWPDLSLWGYSIRFGCVSNSFHPQGPG